MDILCIFFFFSFSEEILPFLITENKNVRGGGMSKFGNCREWKFPPTLYFEF